MTILIPLYYRTVQVFIITNQKGYSNNFKPIVNYCVIPKRISWWPKSSDGAKCRDTFLKPIVTGRMKTLILQI